jgi:hypothetical protein
MVQRAGSGCLALLAKPDIATGFLVQHERKILRPHHRGDVAADLVAADHPRCGALPDFGNFRIRHDEMYDRYFGTDQLMPFARGVSAKSHDFDEQGEEKVVFESPADLIFKTPGFFTGARKRLEQDLAGVYRFVDRHFEGQNLYYAFARRNIDYVRTIAEARDITLLRRKLPDCGYAEAA